MKVKKIFCLFLIFLLFIPTPVFARSKVKLDDLNQLPCKAVVLMGGNQILAGRNYKDKSNIASMTKIMTIDIAAESIERGDIKLEDKVPVTDVAKSTPGQRIYLDSNEEMTAEDMLKAISLYSANDATVAMAEFIGGTEPDFVEIMNTKAKQLGMEDTKFCDSTGLDDANSYSTAKDVAIMARELLTKHPWIKKYTSKYSDVVYAYKSGSDKPREIPIYNTNKLVRFYKNCTGLKTGTTDAAGFCLCCSATEGFDNGNGGEGGSSENSDDSSNKAEDFDEEGKMSLIAVCLGAQPCGEKSGSEVREEICKQLLEYGFSSFKLLSFNKSDQNDLTKIAVDGGRKSFVNVEVSKNSKSILVKKGTSSNIEKSVKLENETLKAPIKKGQVVGKMVYSLDGKEILKLDIVTKEEVKKVNFGFLLWAAIKNFFAGIKLD